MFSVAEHRTGLVLCERTVFKCLLVLIAVDNLKSVVDRLLAVLQFPYLIELVE